MIGSSGLLDIDCRLVEDSVRVEAAGRVPDVAVAADQFERIDQFRSEHGWDQYLYKNMTHYNMVGAELINPLELVGGYGHIRYASGGFNPNRIFYETTVDVEKA